GTGAGNISITLGGNVAGSAAVAVNVIQDNDTAIIDDSTASSGGNMFVSAGFGPSTVMPAGQDTQIVAVAVSGAGNGTGYGAFAGSLSLNLIGNTVEAKVTNIAASQSISAAGKLSVLAGDSATIDSLAGAIAVVGFGSKAIAAAIGASLSYNEL